MWLSVLGIYKSHPDLWDNLHLPTQLNTAAMKEALIDDIMLETCELETIYPDYEILKYAIGSWSTLRLHTWQKIADALYHQYDPFINFTRDENRTVTETRNLAGSEDLSNHAEEKYDNIKDVLAKDHTETRNLASSVTTSATAFDSNALAVTGKQDGTDTGTDRNAGTDTNTKTGSKFNSNILDRDTTDTGTITTEDYFHSQGDSAMYTPTDIAGKEMDMRAAHDIIELIKMEFKTRFCIMVY